ncbi:MAG: hypothetical protein KatS3mg070_0924 [Meiothermus sp.]|nr:MAG: hypothetical protein KatS3mg070_0924 [Meiothermus sp.]
MYIADSNLSQYITWLLIFTYNTIFGQCDKTLWAIITGLDNYLPKFVYSQLTSKVSG